MPKHVIHTTREVPETRISWTMFNEDKALDLPGTNPIRIRQSSGRFDLKVDGVSIGSVSSGHVGEDGQVFSADLNNNLPARLVEPVLARLRPLASYIQRSFDEGIRMEREVMDRMLASMGPIDSAKVKVSYAGTLENINALLYPGVSEEVLGPEFRLQKSAPKYGHYEISGSFGADEITFPAFRIQTGRAFGAQCPIDIVGRGNRERARHGFVSAALDAALRLTQEIAADPALREAADRMRPSVLARIERARPAMRPQTQNLIGLLENPIEAPRAARDMDLCPPQAFSRTDLTQNGSDRLRDEVGRAPFGDGFSVKVRNSVFHDLKAEILFQDKIIYSEGSGFLPGIPNDLAPVIWFAAQFAAGEAVPAYAQRRAWTIAGLQETAAEIRTPQEKVAAAFDMTL